MAPGWRRGFYLKSYLRNHGPRNQCAIVADRFHRAILHRLLALGFLFRRFWLFEDDGMTTLFVTPEIHWGRLPTQIAINTLIVDVIATQRVSRALVCNLRHKITSF
jgi:hypothetical protein